jgi:uncharacterized protein (DUF2235 family)
MHRETAAASIEISPMTLHAPIFRYASPVASPEGQAVEHAPKPEPKNLVICCDSTGNEISEKISNVLKLFCCLRKTDKTEPRQMLFYDPGDGTVMEPTTWHL